MSFYHILVIVLLLLPGCGETKEQAQQPSDADSARVDSLEANQSPMPEPVGPGLAPGQAKIKAVVNTVESTDKGIKISVEVQSVLEYGSSTTPIASGETLTFYIEDTTLNITSKDTLSLLVQQRVAVQSDHPEWSLVKVLN